MKIALVDNGSLEAASHESLRAAAAAIGERSDASVEAVSWKHSDRIPSYALPGDPAWTLEPWVLEQVAAGEHDFIFIPFFISPQGAIGSALRRDIEALQARTGGFEYTVSDGLGAEAALAPIVADNVRATITGLGLTLPAVIVVDHGGPSGTSASVRDQTAGAARVILGSEIAALEAASMESPGGPAFEFNRPLLEDALGSPGFDSGDVVIAPLFLSPGRHAGPAGDLARIAREAQARSDGLRCHFTALVGSHPLAIRSLSDGLMKVLRAPAIS